MALSHGISLLNRHPARWTGLALACALTAGCGLVVDAIQLVQPIAADEVDRICAKGRLDIGLAVEPRMPFVFPAIWTDEGSRVTGLDVDLVKAVAETLARQCGTGSVRPVIHLVRFHNLFVELNEGKLDLFVSAVTANVPTPTRAGLAYSAPYFTDGALGGIARRPELIPLIRGRLAALPAGTPSAAAANRAFAGLTVAVQDGAHAQLYADAHLPAATLILCDSLPAAFETADPPADIVLGNVPVFRYLTERVRKEWRLVTLADGTPLVLRREQYAVVMAEESYRLRRLIDDLLFDMGRSERLSRLQRRWFDEPYAYPRRAATEGLPFDVEKMAQQFNQGHCRKPLTRQTHGGIP